MGFLDHFIQHFVTTSKFAGAAYLVTSSKQNLAQIVHVLLNAAETRVKEICCHATHTLEGKVEQKM